MQLSENHGRLVASPPEGLNPSHSSGGLVGGHQQRSAFVLHEEHDEFRRFGLACVPPNDVDIIRAFVEGLTRCQSRFPFPPLTCITIEPSST